MSDERIHRLGDNPELWVEEVAYRLARHAGERRFSEVDRAELRKIFTDALRAKDVLDQKKRYNDRLKHAPEGPYIGNKHPDGW